MITNKFYQEKEVYEKPEIEVIEMETEGILCASPLPGWDDGGNA